MVAVAQPDAFKKLLPFPAAHDANAIPLQRHTATVCDKYLPVGSKVAPDFAQGLTQ